LIENEANHARHRWLRISKRWHRNGRNLIAGENASFAVDFCDLQSKHAESASPFCLCFKTRFDEEMNGKLA